MIPRRSFMLAAAALFAPISRVFGQSTRPALTDSDQMFYRQVGKDGVGVWIELEPEDPAFIPRNQPVFGAAVKRSADGGYTGRWVVKGSQPATKPADVGSVPPLVEPPKPAGIHVASGESITAALKLAGAGTVVYLAAGGQWSDPIDGNGLTLRSITIAAYGQGAKPLIKVKSGDAITLWNAENVLIQGIEFTTEKPTLAGLKFQGFKNLELKDCDIHGFTMGVVCEAFGKKRSKDFKLTNCHVHDNYNPKRNDKGEWADSTGVYIDGTDGIVFTDNLIDGNGWREGIAPGTDRNHGAYITGNTSGFVATGNTFAYNSAWGLQARSGGIVEGNTFYNNASHLSFGYVNGAGPLYKDSNGVYGVSGRVSGNTFVGERKMNGQRRGVGVVFGNCKLGAVECVGNIFANDNPATPKDGVIRAAIKTDVGVLTPANHPDQGQDVGVKDLMVKDNKGVWPGGMFKSNTRALDTRNVQQVFEPVDVAALSAVVRAKVGK